MSNTATARFYKGDEEVHAAAMNLGGFPDKNSLPGASLTLFDWLAEFHGGNAPPVDFDRIILDPQAWEYTLDEFIAASKLDPAFLESEYGLKHTETWTPQEQVARSIPAARDRTEECYYALVDHKMEKGPVRNYAGTYDGNKDRLGWNWNHSGVLKDAFPPVMDKTMTAKTIKSIQEDENSLFRNHNKIANYDVYTVPARPYRLLPLGNTAEVVEKLVKYNPDVAGHIREEFATRFIGRSYQSGRGNEEDCANKSGTELSLGELAALAGEKTAEAVAGPDWRAIAGNRYLKIAESDIKAIRKIIEDGLPDDKLAAAVEWNMKCGYGNLQGAVQNNWPAFAEEYEGFEYDDHEGGKRRFLVSDAYLDVVRKRGSLQALKMEWVHSGALDALSRIESQGSFCNRFAETFMRMTEEKYEMIAVFNSSHIWLRPGRWEDRTPRQAIGPAAPRPLLG